MPRYVFIYRSGEKFENPEDGARHMEKRSAWVSGLGETLISPNAPLSSSRTVSSSGVSADEGPNPPRGYSIIAAKDMGAALEIAQGCPHLDVGTIEVAELMES